MRIINKKLIYVISVVLLTACGDDPKESKKTENISINEAIKREKERDKRVVVEFKGYKYTDSLRIGNKEDYLEAEGKFSPGPINKSEFKKIETPFSNFESRYQFDDPRLDFWKYLAVKEAEKEVAYYRLALGSVKDFYSAGKFEKKDIIEANKNKFDKIIEAAKSYPDNIEITATVDANGFEYSEKLGGYFIGQNGLSIDGFYFDGVEGAVASIALSYLPIDKLDENGEPVKHFVKMDEQQARAVERALKNDNFHRSNANVKARWIASYYNDHNLIIVLLPYYIEFVNKDGSTLFEYAIDNKRQLFKQGRGIVNLLDLIKKESESFAN